MSVRPTEGPRNSGTHVPLNPGPYLYLVEFRGPRQGRDHDLTLTSRSYVSYLTPISSRPGVGGNVDVFYVRVEECTSTGFLGVLVTVSETSVTGACRSQGSDFPSSGVVTPLYL